MFYLQFKDLSVFITSNWTLKKHQTSVITFTDVFNTKYSKKTGFPLFFCPSSKKKQRAFHRQFQKQSFWWRRQTWECCTQKWAVTLSISSRSSRIWRKKNKMKSESGKGNLTASQLLLVNSLCPEWFRSSWPARCAPLCWGTSTYWGVLRPGCFSQRSADSVCHSAAFWTQDTNQTIFIHHISVQVKSFKFQNRRQRQT